MGRIVIHVGYPKTGSSWIQKFLFADSGAGFGPILGRNDEMRSAILEFLIRPHPLAFDPDICVKHFHPSALDTMDKGLIQVLSHERLVGTPHSGGYDSKELANRIAEVFPKGKVLIIIREQKSMIVSTYGQYVRNGGVCSLARYLYPPRLDGRIPLFNFEYFEYHALIRHYVYLFGDSNVLVLPYELFKDEPAEFVLRIIRFAGADAHVDTLQRLPYSNKEYAGLLGLSTAIKRCLNPIVARRDSINPQVMLPISRSQEVLLELFLEKLGCLVPRSFQRALVEKLKETVFKIVGDRYRESNHIVEKMLHLDLRKYGYDLS